MLVLQTEVTKFKMTPLVLLFALTIGHVTGVVELSCSDNATCIEQMLKDTARSLRQQKIVRLFDALTIEPLGMRSARANESPLTRFTKNHAFSFDWNDYTFRVTRPQGRSDVMDLEIYESRSAKDVSDQNPKKSSSKVEEEKEEDKGPHRQKLGLRRRQRKKVLMAVIPLLFGMKSAAVVIFALAIVTALTLKAFVASKLALLVTVGMAAKKLYESYTSGVPETSNVLWNLARYFRFLFGLPPAGLSNAPTMTMPMYVMPQLPQMPQMPEMYGTPVAMPTATP